jgi:hypothetical protein
MANSKEVSTSWCGRVMIGEPTQSGTREIEQFAILLPLFRLRTLEVGDHHREIPWADSTIFDFVAQATGLKAHLMPTTCKLCANMI